MSAPSVSGRHSTGEAKVLSIISGIFAAWAISAIAGMSRTSPPGLPIGLAQHQPRLGPDGLAEAVMVARIDEGRRDAEARQGEPQHVARAAIERGRGDDVAACAHQRGDGDVQRRLAARHAQRARALLQRRHALLEHGDRRIGDAAVDVAADLEVEQARGMVDVAEHEGRRLVDRHRPRAGDRIGMLAGMQGQRIGLQELGFDHDASPIVRSSRRRTPGRCPACWRRCRRPGTRRGPRSARRW